MSEQYLSQKEVTTRWRAVLTASTLNEARRLGHIEWVRGKYKAPYYTAEAVEAYIEKHLTQRCGDAPPAKTRQAPAIVQIPPDLLEKATARIAGRI